MKKRKKEKKETGLCNPQPVRDEPAGAVCALLWKSIQKLFFPLYPATSQKPRWSRSPWALLRVLLKFLI